jgi:phospholipase C
MFENRSFDHLLGALKGVDGVFENDGKTVKTECYNTHNPFDTPSKDNPAHNSKTIKLDEQQHYFLNCHHFFPEMMTDIFGPETHGYDESNGPLPKSRLTYPTSNSGFVSTNPGCSPMVIFEDGELKVFHKLAKEFLICDNWFCDMPSFTEVNRAFVHCGTAGNIELSSQDANKVCIDSKTIYQLLDEQEQTWKMYNFEKFTGDWMLLNGIKKNPNAKHSLLDFKADAEAGTLPFYSFLSLGATTTGCSVSMHPDGLVQPGENFLAAVYNTLRNSEKSWENTLLVVTFDENGGLFDHVKPPTKIHSPYPGTPAPVKNYKDQKFDFTMLGLRVPALLISPWLAKGSVDHTQYQNTSILKFTEELVASPLLSSIPYLTARDRNATSFVEAFNRFGLTAPRTDCPSNLPYYAGFGDIPGLTSHVSKTSIKPTGYLLENLQNYMFSMPGHPDSGRTITQEFQSVDEMKSYIDERIKSAEKYFAEKG